MTYSWPRGRGCSLRPKRLILIAVVPTGPICANMWLQPCMGIGARLDKDPSLFFKLRKAKMKDLVTQTIEDKTRKLLKKAKKKTTRVIDESDLADVFGIDFEEPVVVKKKRAKAPKRASRRKKSLMPASKKTKARSATGKPAAKTPPQKASPKIRDRSLFDTVVGIIKRSRKGITACRD